MQHKIRLEPEDRLCNLHSCYLHKAQRYSTLLNPNSFVVQAAHNYSISQLICTNLKTTILTFHLLYSVLQFSAISVKRKIISSRIIPAFPCKYTYLNLNKPFNLFLQDKMSNTICILFYRHQCS